jgi:hypothetical protein
VDRSLVRLAIALPLAVFVVVYGLHVGHGFIEDDYNWVLRSRVHDVADLGRLLVSDNGFYRPVVSLSFAIDEWIFGPAPLGYGLTNLALALGCAGAIGALVRAFGLPRGAAWFAALLWLMNFYFAKTAVLWISGRTALVVTLAGVLAAASLLRGRMVLALLGLALAVLAKEEAVLLPLILVGWLAVRRPRADERFVWTWIAGSSVVLMAYFVARSFTGAMTPATAPAYYRFTADPAVVLRNIGEYADRTSTVAVAALLGGLVLLGRPRGALPALSRQAVTCGLLWLGLGLGFAYLLPLRSDLYAAMPSVGASLAAAGFGAWLWQAAPAARRRRALAGAMVAVLILSPVYWLRTARLVRVAEFSAARLEELTRLTDGLPRGSTVRVDDVESTNPNAPNLAAAFGAAIADAYELRTGRLLDVTLVGSTGTLPPLEDAAPALHLQLDHGQLQIVR